MLAVGTQLLAIVLTGMGKDGVEGARAVRAAKTPLWTKSSLTAAINSMPMTTAATHGATDHIPLNKLAAVLARDLERGTEPR